MTCNFINKTLQLLTLSTVLYSTANDPQTAKLKIPSETRNGTEFVPLVVDAIFNTNRSKLLTVFYMDILNSHDKEFFGKNYKSPAECPVIGCCLYIAITYYINLTEAKIANELMLVQSLTE